MSLDTTYTLRLRSSLLASSKPFHLSRVSAREIAFEYGGHPGSSKQFIYATWLESIRVHPDGSAKGIEC